MLGLPASGPRLTLLAVVSQRLAARVYAVKLVDDHLGSLSFVVLRVTVEDEPLGFLSIAGKAHASPVFRLSRKKTGWQKEDFLHLLNPRIGSARYTG